MLVSPNELSDRPADEQTDRLDKVGNAVPFLQCDNFRRFIFFSPQFCLQAFSPVEFGKCTLATSLSLLGFLRTTAEYMY
jgi:hypothetical protein